MLCISLKEKHPNYTFILGLLFHMTQPTSRSIIKVSTVFVYLLLAVSTVVCFTCGFPGALSLCDVCVLVRVLF